MEFHGKLYGKISDIYFDTGKTTDDYDKLVELLKEAANLVGNPCTGISVSTDLACEKWQSKLKFELKKQDIQL